MPLTAAPAPVAPSRRSLLSGALGVGAAVSLGALGTQLAVPAPAAAATPQIGIWDSSSADDGWWWETAGDLPQWRLSARLQSLLGTSVHARGVSGETSSQSARRRTTALVYRPDYSSLGGWLQPSGTVVLPATDGYAPSPNVRVHGKIGRHYVTVRGIRGRPGVIEVLRDNAGSRDYIGHTPTRFTRGEQIPDGAVEALVRL